MKVIDTLTQEDFQKLLERYNKCIAAGGDYFEGDKSFMCALSIKVPIRKESGNLSYAPRISLSSDTFSKIAWFAIFFFQHATHDHIGLLAENFLITIAASPNPLQKARIRIPYRILFILC